MALKAVLGFEWQGDNVLLARENVLWTILEYYKYYCSSTPISHDDLLELADIVSWNIWQMDGLKFVVPMSCKPKEINTPLLDGTIETRTKPCPGCAKKHILDGAEFHNGDYSKIMDWGTGEPHEFVWHYLHRDRVGVEKEKRELQ
jgi:hypothetical protein